MDSQGVRTLCAQLSYTSGLRYTWRKVFKTAAFNRSATSPRSSPCGGKLAQLNNRQGSSVPSDRCAVWKLLTPAAQYRFLNGARNHRRDLELVWFPRVTRGCLDCYDPRNTVGAHMKVEITDLLDLTQEQTALIDMHSVVNIMNVLINELDFLQEAFQEGEPLQRAVDEIQQINYRLRNSADIETELGNLLKCESHVMKLVRAVLDAHPKAANDSDVRGSVSNLQSVFAILDTRGRELLARVHAPEEWTDHDVEQLTKNFTNVLAAIEKNSKGRYRIVHNIAEQEQQDYIVNFSIDSVDGTAIHMPPVLQDVMRDLIANARKYTGPGGEISAGLADNGKELRLVVEDSGRGIPSDEVQQVVEFGKRGSNVDDKATMGGGFGLTKAYLVTRRFGGRMWIDSSPGAGTRITISIPRPAA